jgi:hypothetical protein
MTVCIAAANVLGELVTASDQMLSMANGAFSGDGAALKSVYLTTQWRAMFSGDVGVVPSLVRRIKELGGYPDTMGVDVMAGIAAKAFQDERRQRAVEIYLSPLGVSLDDFRKDGATIFGDAGAAIVRERIEQHSLDCELLLTAQEGDPPICNAHVLHVADPGVVKDMEVSGYWAIGSGAYLALSALAVRRQHTGVMIADMIYNVCEAKFAAESAAGVGKDTFVCAYRPDGTWATLSPEQLAAMRSEWEQVGKPRPAKTARNMNSEWIKTATWHSR